MTEISWAMDAFFYHIYPLGLCGAPARNDFSTQPVPRLEQLYRWLDPIQKLGATVIYLGPVFESSVHGYDTADYYQVDRRLGNRQTLVEFSREIHRRGLRLVLDGVFNHVGRDFWAFRDVLANRERSNYVEWFYSLDFKQSSPYGDPFSYNGWSGHFDLVKLNVGNPEVRRHLLDAVRFWVEEFEIDGLRLDAADQIDTNFLADLGRTSRALRSDFWLMGEKVFGDYNTLLRDGELDSVTNYEVYKALYSCHNDGNYFEMSHALKRQFGQNGLYRGAALYTFADNHDVDRVASLLKDPAHLFPLYGLLFTLPGIPSIYYGSEWGVNGRRTPGSDAALRPVLDPAQAASFPHAGLAQWIASLAQLRQRYAALRYGEYCELAVASRQFAFIRRHAKGSLITAVNSADSAADMRLPIPMERGHLVDVLNPEISVHVSGGWTDTIGIPAAGVRILEVRED